MLDQFHPYVYVVSWGPCGMMWAAESLTGRARYGLSAQLHGPSWVVVYDSSGGSSRLRFAAVVPLGPVSVAQALSSYVYV